MDRRTLLKYLATTALAGYRPAAATPLRVVVAGAGIVGASIAYHLARSGADVTVIDKQSPASHASRSTFAWINATWAKQPRSYHQFSQASVAYWRTLSKELDLPVRQEGSLEWFDSKEREQRLVAQIDEQIAWGEPARMVAADEFRRLEPDVIFTDDTLAALSPNDGTVDPVAATNRMLAAAERDGTVVKYPCTLQGARIRNGRLVAVATSAGEIQADRLVLATGAEPNITTTIADIDIPQRSTPGIIATTAPVPRVLNRIIAAPGVHMHQRDDGRVVIGEQAGAPDTEAHAMRLASRPNDFPSEIIAQEHAQRMLAIAVRFAPKLQDAPLEGASIGWRPLPLDGHPVLGPAPARPDVYIAIMHSGVTLAPLAGRLAAEEVINGASHDLLSPYRADRQFSNVKRY